MHSRAREVRRDTNIVTAATGQANEHWSKPWLVRIPLNLLFIPAAILVCGTVVLACIVIAIGGARNIDFAAYWNASRLILYGIPAVAYGVGSNPFGNILPIAYPPPFLFFIAPFGMLPFEIAFSAWILSTGVFYMLASRTRGALANPAAAYNGLVGQNGFLTTGIVLVGLRLLSGRPFAGGAVLGLMVIKPQLALALPIAVVAGRLWQAIPAAFASAAIVLALAALVFGPDTYFGFFHATSVYGQWLLEGRWPWTHMASFYAIGMWFGSEAIASGIHAVIAVAAGWAVWVAWRYNWESKVPIAASASLLMSPYLLPYDFVLLVAPLAFLAHKRPLWAIAVWALAAIQLLLPFGFYYGPPTMPLAAAVAIVAMVSSESSPFADRGRGRANGFDGRRGQLNNW